MTAIEQALFRDGSAHCVSSFELSSDALMLTLHPWERADVFIQARFDRPRIVSTDDSHAGWPELPWDISALIQSSYPMGAGSSACTVILLSMFSIHLGHRSQKRPNEK